MDSLILASASPRRREILCSLGLSFTFIDPDIDETIFNYLPVPERVLALAEAKARSGAKLSSRLFSTSLPDSEKLPTPVARVDSARIIVSDWILGSDTLVWISGENSIFGKPESEADASRMIHALSGRIHTVSTGIALLHVSTGEVFAARSDSLVSFTQMNESEIDWYIAHGDWEGAAGAYKIQGVAAQYIEKIEGSWSGIVAGPEHIK